jgi:hypothetical protein
MAELFEEKRQAHNLKAVGANPTPATTLKSLISKDFAFQQRRACARLYLSLSPELLNFCTPQHALSTFPFSRHPLSANRL